MPSNILAEGSEAHRLIYYQPNRFYDEEDPQKVQPKASEQADFGPSLFPQSIALEPSLIDPVLYGNNQLTLAHLKLEYQQVLRLYTVANVETYSERATDNDSDFSTNMNQLHINQHVPIQAETALLDTPNDTIHSEPSDSYMVQPALLPKRLLPVPARSQGSRQPRGPRRWGHKRDGRTDLDFEVSQIPRHGTGKGLTDRQLLLLMRLPVLDASARATAVYTDRGELQKSYSYLHKMSDHFIAGIGMTREGLPVSLSNRPSVKEQVEEMCQKQWEKRFPSGRDC